MVSPGREKGGIQLSCSWWGESPVTTSNSTGARGRPAERGVRGGGGGGGGGIKSGEGERSVCVKQRDNNSIYQRPVKCDQVSP